MLNAVASAAHRSGSHLLFGCVLDELVEVRQDRGQRDLRSQVRRSCCRARGQQLAALQPGKGEVHCGDASGGVHANYSIGQIRQNLAST